MPGEDNNWKQNFGGEISSETSTWQVENRKEDIDRMDLSERVFEGRKRMGLA
jgi:hypothetical protein